MSHEREITRRLLERDLVEQPQLRLVWADLLQLDGDALGRLVVLDHAAATAPAALAEQARAEAEALRGQLGPRLWDDPLPAIEGIEGIELEWALGFVRELRIDAERLSHEHTPQAWEWPQAEPGRRRGRRRAVAPTLGDTLRWLVPALVRQPALRWLEVVRVEIDDAHAHAAARCFQRACFASPILREIHVGRPASLRSRPAGQWESAPLNTGWSAAQHGELGSHRQLRAVSLAGERIRVACVEGSTQTRVHWLRGLARQAWTRGHQAGLARALWDASNLVHEAAFTLAAELGPAAEFLLDDLRWFLRPPLRHKDPRPAAALRVLAAIGPASAALLPELLARRPSELLNRERAAALLAWLGALGPAASDSLPWLEAIAEAGPGQSPALARATIARVRG